MLAYNQETGETGSYTVTDVLINFVSAQLHLTLDDDETQCRTLLSEATNQAIAASQARQAS